MIYEIREAENVSELVVSNDLNEIREAENVRESNHKLSCYANHFHT